MMMTTSRFEAETLIPTLEELCTDEAIARDFTCELAKTRPHPDANVEDCLASLARSIKGKTSGPALVLHKRERDPSWDPVAGILVVATMYQARQHVSPAAIFWTLFDRQLHVFEHRYDPVRAQVPLREVTRGDIRDHVMSTIDLFKLHAFSGEPLPGR